MGKIFVGIDPGLTGAVAAISETGRFLFLFDMPVVQKEVKSSRATKARVKNKVEPVELKNLLQSSLDFHDSCDVVVTIEAQTAMQPKSKDGKQQAMGAASLLSLGQTFGMIEAIVQLEGFEYKIVPPQTWKKMYSIPGGDKGKNHSLSMSRLLYPKAELRLKKHHNRAEALLLAKFGLDTHVDTKLTDS